jgi:hypothetical protein
MAEKELSTLKAQQGGWVKASDRLPGLIKPVKWRADGIEMKAKALWYMVHDTNSEYLSNCEWLDENPNHYQELKDRSEKLMRVVQGIVKLANGGIFPHESRGAQMCIEIYKAANEALNGDNGNPKKEGEDE